MAFSPTDPHWFKVKTQFKFYSAGAVYPCMIESLITSGASERMDLSGASLGSSVVKYGAKSLDLTAAGCSLTWGGPSTDYPLGSNDFTQEMFFYPTSSAAGDITGRHTGAMYEYKLTKNADNTVTWYGSVTGSAWAVTVSGPALTLNAWNHIAIVRSGSSFQVFVNGVGGTAVTNASALYAISAGAHTFGRNPYFGGTNALGHLDSYRVTLAARYTANFTPDNFQFYYPSASPEVFVNSKETYDWNRVSTVPNKVTTTDHGKLIAGLRISPRYSTLHDYLTTANCGSITGYVKEKGTPYNPVSRRVLLIREPDAVVEAITWSDPITGAYTFSRVMKAYKYSTVSYDWHNNYRAVIADNLSPV